MISWVLFAVFDVAAALLGFTVGFVLTIAIGRRRGR